MINAVTSKSRNVWKMAVKSVCMCLVSEQFLNGTSAHNRPFQCHVCMCLDRAHSGCCCFRETVAQMIQGGHRVIDNPVYLSDLGIVWLYLSLSQFV